MPDINIFTSTCMIIGYVFLRFFFNRRDRAGRIRITKKEIVITFIFFSLMSLLLYDKIGFIAYMTVNFNIICLAFLGFIDSKTGMLYSIVLYMLIIFDGSMYGLGYLLGHFRLTADGMAAIIIYIIAMLILCFTRAVAVGDGQIYLVQLFLICMVSTNNGMMDITLLIGLVVPLVVFINVEGGRIFFIWLQMRKKGVKIEFNVRRPFAPNLLIGLVFSLLFSVL